MSPPDPATERAPRLVPLVHRGVLITLPVQDQAGPLLVAVQGQDSLQDAPPAGPGRYLMAQSPAEGETLLKVQNADGRALSGTPLALQSGGWEGRVDWALGGVITGYARNLRHPGRDAMVLAIEPGGALHFATAPASKAGRFTLVLPPRPPGSVGARAVTLGIAGSDYVLEGGQLVLETGQHRAGPALGLSARPPVPLGIRIKIACPNLKEAPLWGDYHFANSLAGAFQRLGYHAAVDTADAWYDHAVGEDVVITLRGRHRLKVDPGKVNIMWLISHPDRIPEDEYADYDHVAVASDIYAGRLQGRGVAPVGVLHQATDAGLFGAARPADETRLPACLFVGNSRREYRQMVKWCLQEGLPLELYGGGWDGVVPPDRVRAASIANADLPDFYARHLMLLNDHWDSMRRDGFLSNRLFDGSAVGTPILTDPVAGLADVFGDTIHAVEGPEALARAVRSCLEDPAPYLARAARAREIVLGGHTFDHRARQLGDLIDTLAAAKRPRRA